MQIKKDEVKNALMEAAKNEFLEKGYKKASIRNIVKSANTTIGNFYNYFESKEMVFSALVDNVYHDFIVFLKTHQETEIASTPINQLDINFLRGYLNNIIAQFVPKLSDNFLLLLEYSQDTKYRNVKNEFIDFVGLHFLEHIEAYSPNYKYEEMGRIISSQCIHGFIEIIKTYKDNKIRQELLTEQLLYTSLGVIGILQGYKSEK